jgi:hypothetical protein
MINGDNVDVNVLNGIKIDAMYSKKARLFTKKSDINVDLLQGRAEVCMLFI